MNSSPRDLEKLSILLKVIAAGTAALYTLVYFVRMWLNASAWRATGMDFEWAVPANPQSMIALCLVTAAIALCFLRDGGRFLSALIFGAGIGFFLRWAYLTNQIKTNMGVSIIPQANLISNWFVGAGWIDMLALILCLGMFFADVYLLFSNREKILNRIRDFHLLHS